jgi:hypothetical protein
VERTLGDLAAEIAARYQIRGCDALYVALAQQRERVPAYVVARSPAQELALMAR